MTPRIRGDVIRRRVSILKELSTAKKERFDRRFIGTDLRVLFEGNGVEDCWSGYSDNYIRVVVPSREMLRNRLESVRLIDVRCGEAIGELNRKA